MPNYKGYPVTPDEAVKKGLCAECGCDMTDVDVQSHNAGHWPHTENPEAKRRAALNMAAFGPKAAG